MKETYTVMDDGFIVVDHPSSAIDIRQKTPIAPSEHQTADAMNIQIPQDSELSMLPSDDVSQLPATLIVSGQFITYRSEKTTVYKGTYYKLPVAVKRLSKESDAEARRETRALYLARNHPNIVEYFHELRKDDFIYIFLDKCEATLADVVENPENHFAKDLGKLKALLEITVGLQHLHQLGIIHRDMEPRNILVKLGWQDLTNRLAPQMIICDFGLSVQLEDGEESFQPSIHGEGTRGWQAPEVLAEPAFSTDGGTKMPQRVGRPVDIWGLGCMLYYVLTDGKLLGSDLKTNVVTEGLSSEENDLITSMLAFDANQRPDITACRKHPFFREIDRPMWYPFTDADIKALKL